MKSVALPQQKPTDLGSKPGLCRHQWSDRSLGNSNPTGKESWNIHVDDVDT